MLSYVSLSSYADDLRGMRNRSRSCLRSVFVMRDNLGLSSIFGLLCFHDGLHRSFGYDGFLNSNWRFNFLNRNRLDSGLWFQGTNGGLSCSYSLYRCLDDRFCCDCGCNWSLLNSSGSPICGSSCSNIFDDGASSLPLFDIFSSDF